MMKQIEFVEDPDESAVVPPEMKAVMDYCVYAWSMPAALSLAASAWVAAILGAAISNRFRVGPSTGPSTGISARYESDTNKLTLLLDRPTIVQRSQRMVLLYHHADGMATTMLSRKWEDCGLTLVFTADIKKPPMLMELVIYPGAMYPAGFPESDVCAGSRPIRINVDVLFCDAKSS